ncbi:hypothetical protein E4U42_002950 [Claviceps africana]|uniref:Serine peptidase n=1 Tax=Claviceps africana TaxID=83212 RepID=A0A8K0J7L7_9HYPO|nr:hypothetical protein E4U42_002950 [Claviceps africana]
MHLSLLVAAIATFGDSAVSAKRRGLELSYTRPYTEDVEFHNDLVSIKSHKKNPNIKSATFQQLIDHNNPSLGAFTQRYWYNAEFYAGPGSPIVLNAPGENAADGYEGYTTNKTLPGMFAQTNGGAAILLEHRYWGGSSPYQKLTTETLQYLTLNQSIQDLVYFANNVHLPFDPHGSSKPKKAPWILSGCSYSGALAAWTHHLAPGTFWAYHCSSAPVETIGDYWQYFQPIDEALPRNCSTDFKRISAHVQEVLTTGSETARNQLKSWFGFNATLADDDFVGAIASELTTWQNQQFYSGYGNVFRACDWMEGFWPKSHKTVRPGPEGVGLSQSLHNYAKFWKEYMLPGPGSCGDNTTDCYGTHDPNADFYTNTTVNNDSNRQWIWFLCNEAFEYWQTGSVDSTVGWPSPLLNVKYWRRMCPILFPKVKGHKVGMARGVRGIDVIRRTGGWSMTNTTRLLWVNGEYDPWRAASVASDFRPSGPFLGDEQHPSYVIPKSSHCNDVIMKNAAVNEASRKVMKAEISKMKEWVHDFYKRK